MSRIAVEDLNFREKVKLLKYLLDDLDIELTAYYGATGYVSSKDVKPDFANKKLIIETDIMTG